jgi:hypothetical protein
MPPLDTKIPIIIVGYRNPEDIAECLDALHAAQPEPAFDVYICENGGPHAYQKLRETLAERLQESPVTAAAAAAPLLHIESFRSRERDMRIWIGEANENLGYAGGINAWLRILLQSGNWPGVWILNPDTQPAPEALAELVYWAVLRGKGMVGSCLLPSTRPGYIHSRGLHWSRLRAQTLAVDFHAPAGIEPDPDKLERRLDAPSGASVYVTRSCLDEIGLMDERFFLFFEDLDWGFRAKRSCGVGYAHRSVVPTYGGTTIGSANRRGGRSRLSVYLEFRNRVQFIRKHYPHWLIWGALILPLRALEFAFVGSFENMVTALRGIWAGLRNETGRPDHVLISHVVQSRSPAPNEPQTPGEFGA